MRRRPDVLVPVLIDNLRRITRVFRRQQVTPALVVAFALLGLAVVFAFLAFAPQLSPFVYPLF
jgi:H+/gluconate symporter-like permease